MLTPVDSFHTELEFVSAASGSIILCSATVNAYRNTFIFYCCCSFACLQELGHAAVRAHLRPLTSISPAYKATCQVSVF